MNLFMKKTISKGFTLAEMLIVTAIIAILVSVSIPLFSTQLEKAREAADMANLRAAKAAAISVITAGQLDDGTVMKADTDYWYNAKTGKWQIDQVDGGYGKGTAAGKTYNSSNNPYGYNSSIDHRSAAIQTNYNVHTDGKKYFRICFKEYDKNFGSNGHPDDWSAAQTFCVD